MKRNISFPWPEMEVFVERGEDAFPFEFEAEASEDLSSWRIAIRVADS
jgi:hypothetical protein